MRLSEAKRNHQYIIIQINTDETMKLRLRGLGLAPDTRLQLLFRKRCGTVIVWARGTRLALGGNLAKKVMVEEIRLSQEVKRQ